MKERKSIPVGQVLVLALMVTNLALSILELRQKRKQEAEMFADAGCKHTGLSASMCRWRLDHIIPWFKDDISE